MLGAICASPLALVLAYALIDHVALEALHRWLDGTPRPFTGLRAAGYHASVGLVLGWPAVLAAAAWAVFGATKDKRPGLRRAVDPVTLPDFPVSSPSRGSLGPVARAGVVTPEPVTLPVRVVARSTLAVELLFGAWLTCAGSFAACYPLPKGWTAPLLHAAELGFVVVALAALPAGWRSRRITTHEGRCLGLLVATELCVSLLGAWVAGSGVFKQWRELAQVPYAIGWVVLCGLLARTKKETKP